VAAFGNGSELESVLSGNARFAVEPLPLPRMRDGWVAGLAVKKEADDLAKVLQAAACGSLLSFVAATEAVVQRNLEPRLSAFARATEAAG